MAAAVTDSVAYELLVEYSRSRDLKLRARIIEASEPLVWSIARKFSQIGVSLEDLAQTGRIALIEALERYDPTRGIAFSTFMVPTIRGAIKNSLRDTGWLVSVPNRLQAKAYKLTKERERLERKHGRSLSVSEIAAELEVTVEEIEQLTVVDRAHCPESLDAPEGKLFGRVGNLDLELERVEWREAVWSAIDQLDDELRFVVVARFFVGWTQSEVARQLGVSQQQIARLQQRVLKRLKVILTQ